MIFKVKHLSHKKRAAWPFWLEEKLGQAPSTVHFAKSETELSFAPMSST
jgi:hypothetical protein